MLLEKLIEYFERLEDQAPAMYVKTGIRWLIELDSEGKKGSRQAILCTAHWAFLRHSSQATGRQRRIRPGFGEGP